MYETEHVPEKLMIRDLSIRMVPIQPSRGTSAQWYWITNWTVYPLKVGARARWAASQRTLAIDEAQCCVTPPAFTREDLFQKDSKRTCHLRLWPDGRLAIAVFGDDTDGERMLYIGITRVRMTGTHHDFMCNALAVFHIPEVHFQSWYEAVNPGESEGSFAIRALEEIGDDSRRFSGLYFWDMIVETRHLLGLGVREEEGKCGIEPTIETLDAEVAYEEWLNELASV
ncbi:hypothetical protein KVT40_005187 [Elsinoe batatas]|uniref:Uncharacterized protein n=1 Tax=Elsinoe batatas TaxID=2601811 RepID=A0A8K0KZF2_9PEZI|nr:hypothetical protein KVT40_005187 [Elsinoe batatas]